jgi:endogenous inhibitor of DNA gyrase (YacG/DUF329 family)
MIKGRCPICSKAYEITALGDLPSFPFCTERCRLIDLGRWVDGKYAIPAGPASSPSSADDVREDEDDSD